MEAGGGEYEELGKRCGRFYAVSKYLYWYVAEVWVVVSDQGIFSFGFIDFHYVICAVTDWSLVC